MSFHGSLLFVVRLLRVRLFVMPWTVAPQASLSFTVSRSLLKLVSVESVMPSTHPLSSPSALILSRHQSLPVSRLFTSSGQSTGASTSASVLPVNIQGWFPLGLTGPLLSKRHCSPAAQFKSISFSALSPPYGPTLTSKHDYLENHSFDYMDLCWQSTVSAF